MATQCLLFAAYFSHGQIDDESDAAFGFNGMGGALAPVIPPCTYSAAGLKFNLAGMRKEEHDFTGLTQGGYTYRFNVCGSTNKICNSQTAPASKWRNEKCNNLGDMSTQEIRLLDSTNPWKGLAVFYKDGDVCKRQDCLISA